MELLDALLDSWDRQCRIVTAVAGRIDTANEGVKPSEDGMSLGHQLAHIHNTRRYWIAQISVDRARALPKTIADDWVTPIGTLEEFKAALELSAVAVRETFVEAMANGAAPVGGYDHPVLFLQHMVWHEGWHVGLIFLALRQAGQEPAEEWEEANVWGQWRTEEW